MPRPEPVGDQQQQQQLSPPIQQQQQEPEHENSDTPEKSDRTDHEMHGRVEDDEDSVSNSRTTEIKLQTSAQQLIQNVATDQQADRGVPFFPIHYVFKRY